MTEPEDPEDTAERRAEDDRQGRTPAQRSFHAVLHGLAAGGLDGETSISHGCEGSWIDDYGWDRITNGLIAAGWTPPGAKAAQ